MRYLIEFSPFSYLPFFSPLGDLPEGVFVVVRDRIGEDLGRVSSPTSEEEIGVILRIAEESDLAQKKEASLLGEKSFFLFKEIVKSHQLPIKPVDYHIRLDKSRITFYVIPYSTFNRKKIEEMVANQIPIKARIRKINPRDYARRTSGIGKCGRLVCCVLFKGKLPVVSLRTARTQNLFLPPERISGICGRLLCCLAYEEEIYREAQIRYPSFGSIVQTPYGKGTVIGIDIFHEKVTVKTKESEIVVKLDELSQ